MKSKNKLMMKDYIMIGVLTVVMFVVSVVAGMLTIPFLQFSFVAGSAVTCFFMASIYLFIDYFQGTKKGTFLVSTVVMCFIYILMGWPQMLITMVPAGIIAELILSYKNGYHSLFPATIAWSIYSAIYSIHGAVILWVFGRAHMEDYFRSSFTGERMDIMSNLYYDPVWGIVMMVLGFIFGALGCLFGYKLLKKHFIKSGAIKEIK